MAQYEIPIAENVEITVQSGKVKAKGKKGELEVDFLHPLVSIEKKDGKIVISTEDERRKTKAIMGTWRALLKNMMTGVTKGWTMEMKLVYSHFPVKLEKQGGRLIIKNFLGERGTRKADIIDGVDVRIEGESLKISGVSREKVGQTAANIEQATSVKGFDRRVFQDGVYPLKKPVPAGE